MTDKKICDICGCLIENEEFNFDGNVMCEDCYMDNVVICDECGDEVWRDDCYYDEHTEKIYCSDCYSDTHTRCVNCGEMTLNEWTHESVDGDICDHCYDYYYRSCDDCGALVHENDIFYTDDDVALCSDCYDHSTRHIHCYDYKPDPVFFGDDSRLYLGVELEIDGGGENSENAETLLNIDNNEHIYCKHDGSLNEGFEIVSHPCTLAYHINNVPWEKITNQALLMGYTSHDAKTCGLHVHVSRKALGNDFIEQENTIANILYFVEKYWDKMLKFSRRTPEQLNRWASRYGHEGKPVDILKKAKTEYARYKAINLLPHNTIEFRLFRGTLNHHTFIATLQFVDRICHYCMSLSNEEITTQTWNDFTDDILYETEHELIEYLTNRNILTEDN